MTSQKYVSRRGVTLSKNSLSVHVGDIIKVDEPSLNHVYNIPIVYEDSHLLVIDKPSGVMAHPGLMLEHRPTVTDFLLQRYDISNVGDDPNRPGIVHRLDRDTSGLMVIAKTQEMFVALKDMIALRLVKRRYLGLVHGHMQPIDGIMHNFLERRHKMVVVDSGGKEAITNYKTMAALSDFSLVQFSLVTGRTHQIRVQTSNRKHDIIGDKVYGRRQSRKSPIKSARHMLHAYNLTFPHQITNEIIDLYSQMPDDMLSMMM